MDEKKKKSEDNDDEIIDHLMSPKNRKNIRVCFLVSVGPKQEGNVMLYSDNISTGGVFLETDYPFPIGTELTLKFPLNSTWDPIKVEGKVLWHRKEPGTDSLGSKTPGMGIIFDKIKKADQYYLKKFLDSIPTYGWFLES